MEFIAHACRQILGVGYELDPKPPYRNTLARHGEIAYLQGSGNRVSDRCIPIYLDPQILWRFNC